MSDREGSASIDDLMAVVARLHAPAPEGCPWCLVQTQQTLANELVKEAYELAKAAEGRDARLLAGELGDVLAHILTQVHLAAENGSFTLDDVVTEVTEKLVRRHPHIFGAAEAATPDEVLRAWQAIKQEERPDDGSILDSIPRALPALLRADEMQRRAAQLGFDWPDLTGVVAKVHEEIDELTAAEPGAPQIEELGDLFFALVNVARHLEFSAEGALQQANAKFARRFASVEAACRGRGVRPQDLSLEQLDELWNLAKADEHV